MKALHAFVRGFWRLSLAFAVVAAGGWTVWPGEPGATDPSTREMGRLLAELASRVDPRRMPFQVDDRRADLLAEDLTRPRPILERLQLRFSYASTLLRAGRTTDSLDGHRRAGKGRDHERAGSMGNRPFPGRVVESDGLAAPGRRAQLPPREQSRLLSPPHSRRGGPSEARGRHARQRSVEGHSR